MIMRCDLHVHSRHSFDCFSTIDELAEEALKNRINVLAVTDHDAIGVTKKEEDVLTNAGICYIPGCEFKDIREAHIVGLFINNDIVNVNRDPKEIVDAICQSGGIVFIPHPFKPDRGFASVYADKKDVLDYVFSKTSLIELYSGSYERNGDLPKIQQIADRYGIRVIAASDAHKPWNVGCCSVEFSVDSIERENLCDIFIDKSLKFNLGSGRKCPRNIFGFVGKFRVYRVLISLIPTGAKTNIKRIFYFIEKYYRNIISRDR